VNTLAVVQQQQVDVPETSWVGHMSMAGVGIILLVMSAWFIRGRKRRGSGEMVPMGPWGPLFVSLGDRLIGDTTKRLMDNLSKRNDSEGLDWKSLMTFMFGLFGMTAILSSQPGAVLSLAQWVQDLILSLSGFPILADIGAAGLCFILVLLSLRNRDDDMKDLAYGAVCGLVFPLGGGTFSEITFNVGHWIPQLLHIG
jgi:hypothetical protein